MAIFKNDVKHFGWDLDEVTLISQVTNDIVDIYSLRSKKLQL
jgi:hypothetical protein